MQFLPKAPKNNRFAGITGVVLGTCLCQCVAGAQAGSAANDKTVATETNIVPPVSVCVLITDASTDAPVAARVYIQNENGEFLLPKAADDAPVTHYERTNWSDAQAAEKYSLFPAQACRTILNPGKYTVTVERGKEFFPETREFTVSSSATTWKIQLRRWINMAAEGWYSGDTHVHGRLDGLPAALLAEDLNVALPLLDWTTRVNIAPNESKKSARGELPSQTVVVDAAHVWHPRNTEYEISVIPEVHVLGAFLVLNHRSRFTQPVFPLRAVAEKAHEEGALIDLEKPNWPWTAALVPILKPDLFPLSNNHVWRTRFVSRDYAVPAPAWMGFGETGMTTERAWVDYGFEVYYALLNCGFRLQPSAGSAWGVHPVPLGFSRVYVQLDEPFSFDAWMRGLGAGCSFVTTGPMLFGTVDSKSPGHVFDETSAITSREASCRVVSEHPLEKVELIANGRVLVRFEPSNQHNEQGAYENRFVTKVAPEKSTWLCWRAYETLPGGRFRFAHTAPWHMPIVNMPLLPRLEQITWLIDCVKNEISRNETVLPGEALDEYRGALSHYEEIAKRVKTDLKK